MALVKYNNNSISAITATGLANGTMTLIKEQTASSSSTISFVHGTSDVVLNNTYPIYLFKFINIHPSNDQVTFQFNLSSDTGSNYNVTKTSSFMEAYKGENDASVGGGGLGYGSSHDLGQGTGSQRLTSNQGNGSDESGSGELFIFNVASTTYVKHYISDMTSYYFGDYTQRDMCAGYGNTTSAIDAVKFECSAGTIESGTIKLYGIKDS